MLCDGWYQWTWKDSPGEGWKLIFQSERLHGVRGKLWFKPAKEEEIMNSIRVIKPYKYEGAWVFDDPTCDLLREPFIAGIDKMLDAFVANIPDAANGFLLYFSSSPFPSSTIKLTWVREEAGGNWYYSDALKMEGWLCPALFKYFDLAPKTIFARVASK